VRYSFSRRSTSSSALRESVTATSLLTPLAVLTMLFATNCGSGSSQNNPPLPKVVITAEHQFIDVGQRYFLSGDQTTDPNGDFEDIEFQWRFVDINAEVEFDDHCRNDFDEICDSNDNDHCTNDLDRFCSVDADCEDFGTCDLNSGTTSSDCTTGICGLEEGDENVDATFVARTAGPFSVRLTAIGSKSNGTKTKVLDTFPSLYVVGSLLQFGGTQGADLGEVVDADQYAAGASEGAADPKNGNLVIIDDSLDLIRVFDLRAGTIVGPFGESDRFAEDPTAIAFNPENNRLFVAEASGRVLMFDDDTGLLISTFGNVGVNPIAIAFSPVTGHLLVVNGVAGSGVKVFDGEDGSPLGVLGDTDSDVTEPVDLAFLSDSALLIADRTGRVVRCNAGGTNCGAFSATADTLLAAGSPSAIAVNPSQDDTTNDVMIADPVGNRVIACNSTGNNCGTFGDTANLDSDYLDVFFAPTSTPTTTTSSTTSTTLEDN